MNTTTWFIILIAVGMTLQGCFIAAEYKKKWLAAVILKGLASVFFVTVGLVAYDAVGKLDPTVILEGHKFAAFVKVGLVFGLLGDVALNLRFVFEKIGQKFFLGGIFLFLVGHIMYLLALIPISVHPIPAAIVGAVLAAALLAYIFKTMEVKKVFKIFGVVYLGAVIIMTAIALDIAIFAGHTLGIVYAIGAVLFTASDIILIFNTFSGGEPKFSKRICNLSLYYIGQILIALSIYFIK